MQKKAGIELDSTCQICLRTKFADGVGHTCNYCSIRCCAKCGGKVTLRSTKVIWVCILCRKKQELMIKTGGWMHASQSQTGDDDDDEVVNDAILRRMEADLLTPSTAALTASHSPYHRHHYQNYEQRQRQQLHSGTGGGGVTSLFTRAMSLSGTSSNPSGLPDSVVGAGAANYFGFSSSAASTPTHTPTGSSSSGIRGRFERVASLDRPGVYGGGGGSFLSPTQSQQYHHTSSSPLSARTPRTSQLPRQRSLESSESLSPAGPPQISRFPLRSSEVRGGGDGQMRTRARPPEGDSRCEDPQMSYGGGGGALFLRSSSTAFPSSASFHTGPVSAHLSTAVGRNMGSSGHLVSSRERFHLETASAPEDVAEFPFSYDAAGSSGRGMAENTNGASGGSLYHRVLLSDGEARDLCPPMLDTRAHSDHCTSGVGISRTRTRTPRKKLDATFRNDSLSSDQSECVQRPHPPRPHKSKRRLPSTSGMRQTGRAAAAVAAATAASSHAPATAAGAAIEGAAGVGGRRKRGTGGSSFASSSEDDEIRSTPEYTSCGEEMESESVSEKGRPASKYIHAGDVSSWLGCVVLGRKGCAKGCGILA